jgi:hypothetical protein
MPPKFTRHELVYSHDTIHILDSPSNLIRVPYDGRTFGVQDTLGEILHSRTKFRVNAILL